MVYKEGVVPVGADVIVSVELSVRTWLLRQEPHILRLRPKSHFYCLKLRWRCLSKPIRLVNSAEPPPMSSLPKLLCVLKLRLAILLSMYANLYLSQSSAWSYDDDVRHAVLISVFGCSLLTLSHFICTVGVLSLFPMRRRSPLSRRASTLYLPVRRCYWTAVSAQTYSLLLCWLFSHRNFLMWRRVLCQWFWASKSWARRTLLRKVSRLCGQDFPLC